MFSFKCREWSLIFCKDRKKSFDPILLMVLWLKLQTNKICNWGKGYPINLKWRFIWMRFLLISYAMNTKFMFMHHIIRKALTIIFIQHGRYIVFTSKRITHIWISVFDSKLYGWICKYLRYMHTIHSLLVLWCLISQFTSTSSFSIVCQVIMLRTFDNRPFML